MMKTIVSELALTAVIVAVLAVSAHYALGYSFEDTGMLAFGAALAGFGRLGWELA